MPTTSGINRNLALEAVRATERAAIAASAHTGLGDEEACDSSAVVALKKVFKTMLVNGQVTIGERAHTYPPLLSVGEKVGQGTGPEIDVALEPLESITSAAKGGPNALSIAAMTDRNKLASIPAVYMNKIALGPGFPEGVIDLDASPAENLREIAKAKKCAMNDLVVCMLERPRHDSIIESIRSAGSRLHLIPDGDVSAVIATCWPETGIDVYMGIGGALEGVLGAMALKCMGGQFQGRLVFRNAEEKKLALDEGITDFEKKYSVEDLVSGPVMFAATGVTDGTLLRGVKRSGNRAQTHSLVMNSKSGTFRFIESHHCLGQMDQMDV